VLAQIAKEDDCYILVENRNQVLQYMQRQKLML